jgi:mercuric ion binding protein
MKQATKVIVSLFASVNLMATLAIAEETAKLQVSGVVCSFCAQGIQKRFQQTGVIKSVEVDLDKHEVSLVFLDSKTLSDTEIGDLLESAGYNLLKVQRATNVSPRKWITP